MLNSLPTSPTFNSFWIIQLSVVQPSGKTLVARFCTPAARRAVRELGWSSCGTRWEPRASEMLGVDALKIIPRYPKLFKIFFFFMVFAFNPWWKPLQSQSNFRFCICRGTEGGTKVGLGPGVVVLRAGNVKPWRGISEPFWLKPFVVKLSSLPDDAPESHCHCTVQSTSGEPTPCRQGGWSNDRHS